ncbi:GGDEF and EAL domain protein [Photobacterium marinum]|uniref:GGDEF and EAL domain protein n=1 Tax=Photobacterium marinum TaxID=1056511 RepID=L8JG94_9GAMM|nr:EAL domain-containing protein [Photobacterium marinum]ELR66539.1 GGDEF and EAL domain protein [Photobacterium marinum]
MFTLLMLTVATVHFTSVHSLAAEQYHRQIRQELNTAEAVIQQQHYNHEALLTVADELISSHQWSSLIIAELTSGQTIERHNHVKDDSVPAWFVSLELFEHYTSSRTLINKQRPTTKITITFRPTIPYEQLWQTGTHFFRWILAVFIIAGACYSYLLQSPFRPLKTLISRAQKLMNNQFEAPIPLPNSSDLKAIVKVINHLTAQLEINFKVQAKEAVKLKEEAYRDPVSGLGNRNFYVSQLNSWLANSAKGGLAILKTSLIDDCYRLQGFGEGDKLVKEIAERLNEAIILSDLTLARLSFDEFALLAPTVTEDKLQSVAESMKAVVDTAHEIILPEAILSVQVGLLINTTPSDASTLLTQLDNALTKAALTPQNPIALIDEHAPHSILGKQQWKQLLLEAIDNDYFVYQFQPVSLMTTGIYQYEVFTAIKKAQQVYTASEFLGAIEDLEVGSLFDRHVIAQLINRLNANPQLGPLAINITNSSVKDPAFIRWLSKILEKNQILSDRLFFELPEESFVRSPDSTGLLCSAIRFYKFKFGVDNYGRHFKSLDYLKEFRPDYVKIDFAYTNQLNDQIRASVLSSISRTAYSLNIMTIATRVETQTQLDRLSELFVSGFQGFIIEQQCMEREAAASYI